MAKLFIIAGHGAGDPGACSDGYSEADLVRKLAALIKTRGGDAVEVGDTRVNWYASDWISLGKCPSGVPVLELHMDSAGAGAKGGHVIIKSGLSADAYDNALAKFISSFMPGRSEIISYRSNLANVNRAYKKGVNYRLLECCFISDDGDRNKFIDQMADLADGILEAFGISKKVEVELPKLPDSLSKFKDVDPTAWYVGALDAAVRAGYMHGCSETVMAPNVPLTRGQAVVIIANASGFTAEHPYSDVVASPYYYDAVAWAKENGIVSSNADEFRPDDNCTRQEFATMLYNWKGEDAADPKGYTDWDQVADWAKRPMAWAVSVGVISGNNGKLNPNDACTRAEAAAMMVRLLK